MTGFTDAQIERLLYGVFNGEITERDLPENLYYAIAEHLKKGLYSGYGGSLKDFKEGTKDLELLTELRENIYMFSAAKTYQEVRMMTDVIADEDGIRSFSNFKKAAGEIFDTYNEDYLKTEYNTAVASGQQGSLWNDIQKDKDDLPYLLMSVVEDDNTSEICEPLDGICLPVDDDFWDEFYPPNHFNCRSTVEQLDEFDGKKALSSKDDVDEAEEHADKHMQDIFRMNVGKDAVVFKEDHPYFTVPKEDKAFAQKNFGLDIPDDDE